MVHITLLYFEDCPNLPTVRDRLHAAIQRLGPDLFDVELRAVRSIEQAVAEDFCGSPSILINGVDPFAQPTAAVGMACRIYPTPEGPAGSPTVAQLVEALAAVCPR
jgi:hypothetical protein